MKRFALTLLLLGLVTVAYGQTFDPTAFCPDTISNCNSSTGLNGTGLVGETIGVGATSFVMVKNGNVSLSSDPWFLILALPEYTGAAPTLSTSDFTQQNVTEVGHYLPTSDDLYTFTGLTGPDSMNATNMFGPNEQAAFGGTPTFFDVFVYQYTPAFAGAYTPYSFTVGGSGLPAGTFLAASGGSNAFATPFTLTGLVNGPGCPDDVCGGGGGGNPVPEPSSIVLMGTVMLFGTAVLRNRMRKSS